MRHKYFFKNTNTIDIFPFIWLTDCNSHQCFINQIIEKGKTFWKGELLKHCNTNGNRIFGHWWPYKVMKNSLKTVCGNLFDNTETIFFFITSFYSPIHTFQKIVSLCMVNPQVKRKKKLLEFNWSLRFACGPFWGNQNTQRKQIFYDKFINL